MGIAGKAESHREQRERVREHVRKVLAKINGLKNSRTRPELAACSQAPHSLIDLKVGPLTKGESAGEVATSRLASTRVVSDQASR
jgi:hypothetical protein